MLGPFSFLEDALATLIASVPELRLLGAIDYVLLITLGVFALDGARRGVLLGAIDLGTLVVGLSLAVALHGAGTDAIESVAPSLGTFAPFIALTAVGGVVALLGSLAARVVDSTFVYPMRRVGAFRFVDGLLGVPMGFARGALLSAVALIALSALPLATEIARSIDQSPIAERLVPLGRMVAPDLGAIVTRISLGNTVLAPPPRAQLSGQAAPALVAGARATLDPEAELDMVSLVNRERASGGLTPLVFDDRLTLAARDHGLEMARLGYFAHQSPISGSPFDRLVRSGVRFTIAGENLALAPTAESAHRGLMNSPEHRRNILSPTFRRIGIGAMLVEGTGMLFTQAFTD
ncbi:MAG: hypothetical protein EPO26_06065 [Chloroflexota bacterium]|nr:MAG: hypothetical protein EPO26_06065 [Chloroflexota bacterium]